MYQMKKSMTSNKLNILNMLKLVEFALEHIKSSTGSVQLE